MFLRRGSQYSFHQKLFLPPLLGFYVSRCRTDLDPKIPTTVQGHTGSLVSPGYPYSYPIITCTWNIVVPDGYMMVMNLVDFEISCEGGSKLLLGEDSFCGSNKPSRLLTFRSDLKVQMVAKKAKDNRGFRATFLMTKRDPNGWFILPFS